MTREQEYNKIFKLIELNFNVANCGMFFSRNTVGDEMKTIFDGEHFKLDICYGWQYFELFGANEKEQDDILTFYDHLNNGEFAETKRIAQDVMNSIVDKYRMKPGITNAQRFLKDNVDIDEFINEFKAFCRMDGTTSFEIIMKKFLNSKMIPNEPK